MKTRPELTLEDCLKIHAAAQDEQIEQAGIDALLK